MSNVTALPGISGAPGAVGLHSLDPTVNRNVVPDDPRPPRAHEAV